MIKKIETLICDSCGLRREIPQEDEWLGAQHEADTCRWLTLKDRKPHRHYCPSCKTPVEVFLKMEADRTTLARHGVEY